MKFGFILEDVSVLVLEDVSVLGTFFHVQNVPDDGVAPLVQGLNSFVHLSH